MAKSKSSKGGNTSVPQKHLHSRLSYLHQAASLLAATEQRASSRPAGKADSSSANITEAARGNRGHGSESTRLLTHLRGVSRKTQIRLTPEVKHTMCKRCDSLLVPGKSSHEAIVNPSKDGAKPWADVFEICCHRCGTIKRFPVEPKIKKEINDKD